MSNGVRTMKSVFLASAALLIVTAAPNAYAQARVGETVSGRIASFECGDNCYLTIEYAGKKKLTGLCVAKQCEQWNTNTQMPKSFVGKAVKVRIGRGNQVDASGKRQGSMTSFTSIQFVK